MLSYIYWDPEAVFFTIPGIELPILWYGCFFAAGFWLAALYFHRNLSLFLSKKAFLEPSFNPSLEAKKITDRLSFYLILATVIGARVGHLLFYESPSFYLKDPLEIFKIRNGGLASHGAIVAILFAVFLFSRRFSKEKIPLSSLNLLDQLALAAPLTAAFIRIGNFFNQEILGTASSLPWAVFFAHPADGSFPIPRHPVQLYEALAYLLLFLFFFKGSKSWLSQEGKVTGLLLFSLFLIRFVLEYCKIEQSLFFSSLYITMGQILSIPFILLGLFLLLRNKMDNVKMKRT